MRAVIITLSGGLLAVAGVTVLAMADANLFDEDPDFSPLYKATLDDAFSRFKASEGRVPPGGPATPAPAEQVAQPQQYARGQAPQRPQGPANRGKPGLLGVNKHSAIPGTGRAPGHVHQRPGAPAHVHDDGGVHMKRGSQLMQQRQYDQAIAAFKLALQENPNRPLAQHYIGDVLRTQGKHEAAIAAYQATLKIKPDYYCCFTHMGEIMEAELKTAEAEAFYQQAIAGYKQQVGANDAQSVIAAFNLAKLYLDKNRGTTAEIVQLAEKAGNINPPQAPYLQVLARAYERAGRKAEAIQLMNRVMGMQHDPKMRQYYENYRQELLGNKAAPTPVTPIVGPPAPRG